MSAYQALLSTPHQETQLAGSGLCGGKVDTGRGT